MKKDKETKIKKEKRSKKEKKNDSKQINEEKELKKLQRLKVSTPQLLISIKSMSALLKAGIAISETVDTLSDQSSDENLNKIYTYINRKIESGSTLAEAMAYFPKIFSEEIVSVVQAGEEGGSLENNLVFIAETIKKEYELNKKLKGAIIYPLIIISLTVVEFIGMIFIVLPKLESVFSSFPEVPPFTRFIMDSAQYIREHWMIILGIILVIIAAIWIFLRTKPGKRFLSWLSINFPILKKLFSSNILASFSRTLSVLLMSGIPLSKALDITASTTSNYKYSEILKDVQENTERGKQVSDSLENYEKYFNKSFVKMVEVGESSGTLEDSLMYLHEYYSQEVDEMSNNIVTFVEPILLIFVGLIIGLLGVTVLLPMYQLMGTINA
jgi:type IV pilus assembly protein PilC